jgi:hypothetical protein
MIQYIILQSILFVVTVVLAIIAHELGHILSLRMIGKKWVKVYFNKKDFIVGKKGDLDFLTDKQMTAVFLWGVLAGLIPVFVFAGIMFWLFQGGLILAYFVGCRHDIKFLVKQLEKLDDGEEH